MKSLRLPTLTDPLCFVGHEMKIRQRIQLFVLVGCIRPSSGSSIVVGPTAQPVVGEAYDDDEGRDDGEEDEGKPVSEAQPGPSRLERTVAWDSAKCRGRHLRNLVATTLSAKQTANMVTKMLRLGKTKAFVNFCSYIKFEKQNMCGSAICQSHL